MMMKSKFTKALSAIALGCLSLGIVSCEPEKPQDERKNKLHENPQRAVYTLIEGTLNPETFEGAPSIKDVAIVEGSEQQISYSETKENGWAIEANSKNQEFKVKSATQSPNSVYILKIDYYSPSGAHMNNQFIDNGQDRIHQHFFSLYRDGRLVRSEKSLPYSYRYADTTPWNKEDGQLTGDENPIGFKGIFRFIEGDVRFRMNADLLHGFVPKNQFGAQPFYAPSAKLRSNSDMDIALKLPIVVDNGTKNLEGNKDDKKEDNNDKGDEPKKPETPVTGDLNKTKATKITLKMYQGHLHSPTSFHYVPGPTGFNIKQMGFEREISFEYKDGQWKVADGDAGWLLLIGLNKKVMTKPDDFPTPVYGLWIQYFDKDNKEITSEFARPDDYQHFFTMSDIEVLPLGEPLTAEEKAAPTKTLMGHVYRDTTPWDKSADQKQAKFNDDKHPIGLKGIFYFAKSYVKFNFNIDLWDAKGHKLDGSGKASPFYMPNEDIKKNGEHLLSLSIPVYIPGDNAFYETISDIATDEEELAEVNLEDQDQKFQETAKYFMDLFKVTWEQLRMDLYHRIWGDRGSEKGGTYF